MFFLVEQDTGDADMFVSINNPQPYTGLRYEWASQQSGDDAVTFVSSELKHKETLTNVP